MVRRRRDDEEIGAYRVLSQVSFVILIGFICCCFTLKERNDVIRMGAMVVLLIDLGRNDSTYSHTGMS